MQTAVPDCLDGHAVFRVLLQAFARPGSIHSLPRGARGPDEALLRLLASVLDPEVAFAVVGGSGDIAGRLRLATGGRPAEPEAADFVLFPDGDSGGAVLRLRRGRSDFPDQGATAVYAVKQLSFTGGTAELTGPGIRDRLQPSIIGLGEGELGWLKEVNAEYPLGVDCIFVDPRGQVMCIPRSTRIGGV